MAECEMKVLWNSGQKLLSSLEFSLKGLQRQPSLAWALPLRWDTDRMGGPLEISLIRTTIKQEISLKAKKCLLNCYMFQYVSYISPNLHEDVTSLYIQKTQNFSDKYFIFLYWAISEFWNPPSLYYEEITGSFPSVCY